MLAKILIIVVSCFHICFLILEMFLWTSSVGLKVFKMDLKKAKETSILAANQGLYNGFLAAGLIWSTLYPEATASKHIALFFIFCVIIAALYGGYSVARKILLIQGAPALIALIAILMG